jgi:hypothetical protein
MPNTSNRIDLDKFTAIVIKLADEGYKRVGAFNWTEPFVNPDLHKCMQIIKEQGLRTSISTNFSIRKISHLEKVLRYTDELYISLSGFDQAVYEINHIAGDIEFVRANTRRAAALKASGEITTTILLRFLKFDYNQEQEEKLREFARALHIGFEVLPAVGTPKTPPMTPTIESSKDRLRSFTPSRPNDPRGKVCPLMFGQIPIDSHGDVYLCCAFPNHEPLKIGPYLEMTQEEILLRRYNHPICSSCNFTRRDATPADTQALMEAVQSQMAQPGITQPRLEEEIDQLTKTNQDLASEIGQVTILNRNLANEVGEVATANRKLGDKVGELTAANRNFGDKVGELTAANRNFGDEIAQLITEKGKLATANSELRLKTKSLRSRLNQTQSALADLKRSRLLRLGRSLRRLIGRPSHY